MVCRVLRKPFRKSTRASRQMIRKSLQCLFRKMFRKRYEQRMGISENPSEKTHENIGIAFPNGFATKVSTPFSQRFSQRCVQRFFQRPHGAPQRHWPFKAQLAATPRRKINIWTVFSTMFSIFVEAQNNSFTLQAKSLWYLCNGDFQMMSICVRMTFKEYVFVWGMV